MAASDGRAPRFEIQIVPSDVDSSPRSFRLSRMGVRALGLLVGLYVLFLAFGLAMAPGAVRELASRDDVATTRTRASRWAPPQR